MRNDSRLKTMESFFLLYQALKVWGKDSIIYDEYIFDVCIYLFHNAKRMTKAMATGNSKIFQSNFYVYA